MIVRALLVLSALLLVDARAQSTYVRSQNFESLPDNWVQTSPAQFYGFERTRVVGLTGAAGGLFQPSAGFNHYADCFLGGTFTRGTFLYSEGRLALKRASAQPPFRTTAYVGYFGRPVAGAIETVGLALIGHGEDKVYAAAVVQYSNGKAFSGNWVSLPVGTGEYVGWKFFWNPTGGHGYGSLVVQIGKRNTTLYVPHSAAHYDFAVNTFGWYQPPFSEANANSFLWAYAGALAYTADSGRPPGLHAKGPSRVSASTATVQFRGTSSAERGYRVESVRYRIKRNGKTGAFRAVKGKASWSVEIRLPQGETRVEFEATTDAGLKRRVQRRVVRN